MLTKSISAQQEGKGVYTGQTKEEKILYWDLNGNSLNGPEWDLMEMIRNVRKGGW